VKIGITYDLRADYLKEGYSEDETAEFDRPDTIEAIEKTLHELGFETDRIGHIRHLVQRLAGGDRWDMVFNIAEGLRGYGRESQIPALLDAYNIPYTFSDALVLSLTLHKGMAKRVVRDHQIPTPDFVEVESLSQIDQINLPFPLFAKPIAEGTGKGITASSKITSREELYAECKKLLQTYRQPALVETFLPGREFTVGIWGTGDDAQVVGAMEILLNAGAEKDVYSYVNKELCEQLVTYALAEDEEAKRAQEVALRAYRILGCRDAARVDVRSDAHGNPHFLEINPLAGIHPAHSDLPIICTLKGIPYRELIDRIMKSAIQRLDGKP